MGDEENETPIEHTAKVSAAVPSVEEARAAAAARRQEALDRAVAEREPTTSAGGEMHDDHGTEIMALEQICKELHEANAHLAVIRRIMVWVLVIVPGVVGLILLIIWAATMGDDSSTYGLGVLTL